MKMNNQRMGLGTPFDPENTPQSVFIPGIRTKPVHRFGWKRDQASLPKYVDGLTNELGIDHGKEYRDGVKSGQGC
jgi:hypothetical protein